MLSFQFFTSTIFVVRFFSSIQIALKGLQKSEKIEKLFSFLSVKRSGGDFLLKRSPGENIDTFFTSIVFFFPSTKYVNFSRTILFFPRDFLLALSYNNVGRLSLRRAHEPCRDE